MFYDTFFELCSQKGVTPNKACVDCEISRTSVAKWKKGSTPNGATLTKLAEYFEVSTDYLLGNEQEKKPTADSSELDKELKGIDFALYGEVKELTDGQKQDVLDFIRFKKAQEQNRGK